MEFQVRSFLSLLFVCIFLTQSFALPYCYTARSEYGECMKLDSCPHMTDLMKKFSSRPDYKRYFEQSKCSNVKNSKEITICCPSEPLSLTSEPINLIYNSVLPRECQETVLDDRIANGENTTIGEYPWMALLVAETEKETIIHCGGSVISERYVLTAAHCVSDRVLPQDYQVTNVRLGEYDIKKEIDCTSYGRSAPWILECSSAITVGIEKTIIYENYLHLRTISKSDIALLRLDRYVSFTEYIKPICLPQTDKISYWLFTAGWGRTETGYKAERKLKLKIPLKSISECNTEYERYNIKFDNGQFCAGDKEAGKDTCDGDSGGPIMSDPWGKWTIFGLVSGGRAKFCGQKNSPVSGIYTKIYDFKPWILQNLEA